MNYNAISIRPFIGAKNYEQSRHFYSEIGFTEIILDPKMSLFQTKTIGFYLQDYYAQDWVDNTMVFLEVEDLDQAYNDLFALNLNTKYPGSKLVPIRLESWGRECFLHDPSGVLWHFGSFKKI